MDGHIRLFKLILRSIIDYPSISIERFRTQSSDFIKLNNFSVEKGWLRIFWVDVDEAVQNSKYKDNLNYLFIHKLTFQMLICSFFRVLKGQWRKTNVTFPSVSSLSGSNNINSYFILSRIYYTLHSAKNQIWYNIVTAIEKRQRGMSHWFSFTDLSKPWRRRQ